MWVPKCEPMSAHKVHSKFMYTKVCVTAVCATVKTGCVICANVEPRSAHEIRYPPTKVCAAASSSEHVFHL